MNCKDYLKKNLVKEDMDTLLVRKVLEKRISLIYESNATEQDVNKIYEIACKHCRTTGQAIAWIFENFGEEGKYEPPVIEALEGGLAEGMTLEDIAEMHDMDVSTLQKQLDMGVLVEKEHSSDPEVRKRIAMDHLYEIPDYYTRLKKMEAEAKKAVEIKAED